MANVLALDRMRHLGSEATSLHAVWMGNRFDGLTGVVPVSVQTIAVVDDESLRRVLHGFPLVGGGGLVGVVSHGVVSCPIEGLCGPVLTVLFF
jgi:hypothetical protein